MIKPVFMIVASTAIATPSTSVPTPTSPSTATQVLPVAGQNGTAGADVATLSPIPAPVRLPGFAAELAQRPTPNMPDIWHSMNEADAWQALSRADTYSRQNIRWNYARSLIQRGRGAEAIGVLDVMHQDDPDLAMVDGFRLARGVAYVQMSHAKEALGEFEVNGLSNNPEACAWRMRALSELGYAEQALQQHGCAQPALAARSGPERQPFILAAVRSAIEFGQAEQALAWLGQIPDRDPTANLYRGRAMLALGKSNEARLRFARVEQGGSMALKMDARLSAIEAAVASGGISRPAALKALDQLRYIWRGGYIEERALRLSYSLNVEAGDMRAALANGATLFRFFEPGRQGPDFVAGLQALLHTALAPAHNMPVDQAAGLFWDYRDITPSGAAGDLLVSQLAERLQSAGLYARAAELLEHQLFVRTIDVAQGPLSARVATLHILAGQPDRAITAIRKTAGNSYPNDMIVARKRVEAVALSQLGKVDEAFAVLQDVPDAGAMRAEILWKRRDWGAYAAETSSVLPSSRTLSDVDQAVILRHAISLAMLGNEGALSALRSRYASAFAERGSAAAFDMLTANIESINPDAISRAMAALPGVSPAGDIAELIDASPTVSTTKGG